MGRRELSRTLEPDRGRLDTARRIARGKGIKRRVKNDDDTMQLQKNPSNDVVSLGEKNGNRRWNILNQRRRGPKHRAYYFLLIPRGDAEELNRTKAEGGK